jgi:hypothetical protein
MEYLSCFVYKISDIPGKTNKADTLTRSPQDENKTTEQHVFIDANCLTIDATHLLNIPTSEDPLE